MPLLICYSYYENNVLSLVEYMPFQERCLDLFVCTDTSITGLSKDFLVRFMVEAFRILKLGGKSFGSYYNRNM